MAYSQAKATLEQIEKHQIMDEADGEKKRGPRDFVSEWSFYRIKCKLSQDEYFNEKE